MIPTLAPMRRTARTFLQQYDMPATVQYIKAHCAPEARQLLEQADALMENRFTFCDRWDMEPCRVPYLVHPGQWTHSPNGDPEWVFMLNRHDFLPKLWQASALTGDSKYTRRLIAFVLNWIESNPVTLEGSASTRTIDTGIRCMNWCRLLPFLLAGTDLTDTDAQIILHSLAEQFINLRKRYLARYTLSNWGVLQTTALCAGYAWLSDFLPQELEDWAWAELRAQLRLQILEDGVHWEQSPLYHVEVLNACVTLLVQLRSAKFAGRTLCPAALLALNAVAESNCESKAGPGDGLDFETPGWLERAVRVMSRHVLHSADPALCQLPQCDSDVTNVRDVLARAAVLLTDSEQFRWGAGAQPDMASIWLFGASCIPAFAMQSASPPVRRSWNCVQSGTLFLRSSWDADANFTAVKNSPLGSSHGHADHTHLTLYHKGKPFLVDSGRYTYREDDPLRTALKGPAAHNVCVIDGQSGGIPDSSWSYADYAQAAPNYFAEKGDAHYAELSFHGTLQNGTPYQITRRLMILDEGIWLSVQDVICQGEHPVREYFHLPADVTAQPSAEGYLLQTQGVQLKVCCLDTLDRQQGILSSQYNQKEAGTVLVKKAAMRNRWTSCTLFLAEHFHARPANVYPAGGSSPLSADIVSAWDVYTRKGRVWTLLIWNREIFRGPKLFTCHGYPVYGKAIALQTAEESFHMIRLK